MVTPDQGQSSWVPIHYDFSPHVTGFIEGQVFQRNFGDIPFLYNGVTASRLDKRYGLASVGMHPYTVSKLPLVIGL